MAASRRFECQRRSWRTRLTVVVVATMVIGLSTAGSAASSPTSPLCDDGSYRRAHPLICDTGGPFPNLGPGGGPGGGGYEGGLIGRILRGLGLGGLL